MSPIGLSRTPVPADGGSGQNPSTVAGLLALAPPGRVYSASPIITYKGNPNTAWGGGQVMEPCILVDPSNSSQLIMFYAGQSHGGIGGYIGRATAPVSNPKLWTPYAGNPLFGGQNRMDSVVYDPVASQFRIYSSFNDNEIYLYTSSDGFTFTSHVGNPVWQPSQVVGLSGVSLVSQAAVYRVDATHWYMYYSYRDSGQTLPAIRVATSSDGIAWTDGGQVWALGNPGDYDSSHKEWHQILFLDQWLLIAECFDGTTWTIGAAQCATPTGTFVKQPSPIFRGSGVAGTFDQSHVATPAAYNIGGHWYLFYCGAPILADYGNDYWSLGMAEF